MNWWRAAAIAGVICCGATPSFCRTATSFVGSSIPASIELPPQGIFVDSDSLYLNGRLLSREADYRVMPAERQIDLSSLSHSVADTLTVVVHEVPRWLKSVYGRDLPEATASVSPVPLPLSGPDTSDKGMFGSNLKLSGSKTFRFTSRTAGDAEFGQSLDLRLSGELAPGLELTGALSDRGYDPAYGTATSRLNELDRLNLQLRSKTLLARIGDITVQTIPGMPVKNVSGASVALSRSRWHIDATAARPKGRFESITLTGQDGFQGPYRLSAQGLAAPVVPGSEVVWLDGRRLERGADRDYTVDYPAGTVTFTARHPIDRRSRIEIDFEPLATTYRQELLSTSGGVSIGDSLLYVNAGVAREGDDRDQLLLGELTESDRVLLESGGDADIYQSGVRTDTAGAYTLVVDSLPDTVLTYTGPGAGEYAVTFTYVGAQTGDYRFLGADRYEYVGAQQGDYLPVRVVARAERTNYYSSTVGLRTSAGNLVADIRQSSHDRNLWSSLDDNDNGGLYYQLAYLKNWKWHGANNAVALKRRMRESRFVTRERLFEVDFARLYLLPAGFSSGHDELLHEANLMLRPTGWLRVSPQLARLEYGGQFSATRGGVDVGITPNREVSLRSTWRTLQSEYSLNDTTRDGELTSISTAGRYQTESGYFLGAGFETDRREYAYAGFDAGLKYSRWTAEAGSTAESIRYERYLEDSLEVNWFDSGTRDRISAMSNRRFGKVGVNGEVVWQRLDDRSGKQSYFLARSTISLADAARQLNVQTSYTISRELRNARGITYLKVEEGRGNYSLEDGRYVPDPFGNYIQVEELLSDRAEVRRGEKGFQLSKNFGVADIRFSSQIQEELLEGGTREIWWIIPFLSDESQPYLFYSRRYDADLRLLPWRNFHAVNLTLSDDLEQRDISGGDNRRHDSRGTVTFKQAASVFLLDQTVELFRSDRDQYYSGAGTVDGYRVSAQVRRTMRSLELSGGAAIRRADATNGDRARAYSALLGSRIRAVGQGEIRADLELYTQNLEVTTSDFSYQLVDNRYGSRGVLWTVGMRYGIRPGVQANINFTGRHSDDRTGRVSGRGEVVASF